MSDLISIDYGDVVNGGKVYEFEPFNYSTDTKTEDVGFDCKQVVAYCISGSNKFCALYDFETGMKVYADNYNGGRYLNWSATVTKSGNIVSITLGGTSLFTDKVYIKAIG